MKILVNIHGPGGTTRYERGGLKLCFTAGLLRPARTLLDSGQFIPGPEGVDKRPYLPKSFVRRKNAILKICKIFLWLHSFSFLGLGQNGHFSTPFSARGAPEPAPLGTPGSFFLREPLSAFPPLETSCFKVYGGGLPCPPVRKRAIFRSPSPCPSPPGRTFI